MCPDKNSDLVRELWKSGFSVINRAPYMHRRSHWFKFRGSIHAKISYSLYVVFVEHGYHDLTACAWKTAGTVGLVPWLCAASSATSATNQSGALQGAAGLGRTTKDICISSLNVQTWFKTIRLLLAFEITLSFTISPQPSFQQQ